MILSTLASLQSVGTPMCFNNSLGVVFFNWSSLILVPRVEIR